MSAPLPTPSRSSILKMASSIEHARATQSMSSRGCSDSAISCHLSTMGEICGVHESSACLPDVAVTRTAQPRWKLQQRPIQVKAKGNLHLPCFKTLGISSRLPNALLTPPDESIIGFQPDTAPNLIPRSLSYPPANMPKTPSPDRSDFATALNTEFAASQASSSTLPSVAPMEPQVSIENQGTVAPNLSGDDENVDTTRTGWLVDATEAASMPNTSPLQPSC